ncbi:putative lipoprotein precursor [Amantichitinum ursilacus]|uniref:Putative lipoprotein n=2 Tax=Amantichitinum ursilacus TaxID=857265 RepID=A0A0N1JRH9_9NEIS|nr:putative lipoprotein precursor [Amantichitinum ursilacus]
MRFSSIKALAAAAVLAMLATGCAKPTQSYDYTAFKRSKPASILVLPPVNKSPDVNATYGMLAQMTRPLAEAGYYVVPVALVDETFKRNGVVNPDEMQSIGIDKLRQTYGADAALYVEVEKYGSSYYVIGSEVTVVASARLVDLRNGDVLWTHRASASSAEQNNNSGGGLIGMLVTAAVKQVMNTLSDRTFDYAGVASNRLVAQGQPDGMLYGPRSPRYVKEQ